MNYVLKDELGEMKKMYEEMYYRLFNTITDALKLMNQERFKEAFDLLENAQRAAEEIYLDGEEL